jgi:phosphoribosylformimino-5-aminoimidazole carboxamide ribotide isomerase
VGSIAATEPGRFSRWLREFGSASLVAALDVQLNASEVPVVRTHGWTRDSQRYPALQVQASGGIRNLQDLAALAAGGADSAISGKALLDNRFTVDEAVRLLQ